MRAIEVRGARTPRSGRAIMQVLVGALAASTPALSGCAHHGRPAVREIVWQGDVTVHGSLVVGAGERLVIRPGTRVRFAFRDENGDGAGDSRIVVNGALAARGTGDAPIEFVPAEPGPPGAAGWDTVLVEDAVRAEFVHCRFVGAQQAVHAHRTPLTVAQSRFEGNAIGLRFTGGPVVIRGNRFVANGTAVRYWESNPTVAANEFDRNATGLFVREGSDRSVVTGNNFLSSTDYHVKLGESQAADVDAHDNWWGTGRREAIERLLFDREDADYLGRVRYDPPAPRPRTLSLP